MPAPQCASCHKARAALRRPRSGQALCGACFCAASEAEVLHTVVAGRLLPPGAVVAVGASGGKDSTVLAHVLRELAPRLGISLRLVAVDEGIGALGAAAHRRGLRRPLRGLDGGCRGPQHSRLRPQPLLLHLLRGAAAAGAPRGRHARRNGWAHARSSRRGLCGRKGRMRG